MTAQEVIAALQDVQRWARGIHARAEEDSDAQDWAASVQLDLWHAEQLVLRLRAYDASPDSPEATTT